MQATLPLNSIKEIFMENTITVPRLKNVESSKMTFGKLLTLNKVLHVPTIRRNLVSVEQLIKNGFKLVLVSEKTVIIKNNMFLGKDYLTKSFSS